MQAVADGDTASALVLAFTFGQTFAPASPLTQQACLQASSPTAAPRHAWPVPWAGGLLGSSSWGRMPWDGSCGVDAGCKHKTLGANLCLVLVVAALD